MQPVHGVLVLDKPYGMSSADAVAIVKRRYRASRVGHTGTLDPLATGILPICLGEATKIAGYMLADDKRYSAGLILGEATSTYDRESPVTMRNEARAKSVTLEEIGDVLRRFMGPIGQVPPQHSAIKVDGKPLYELARAGKQVDMPPRHVVIRALAITKWSYPYLDLDIACSKGTYIRSLAHDIGMALGCYAHLYSLRRTQSGAVSLAQAVGIDALDNKALALPKITPVEQALSWPVAEVPGHWIAPVRVGRPLPLADVTWLRGQAPPPRVPDTALVRNPSAQGMCLLAGEGQLLSLAAVEGDSFKIERGFLEGLTLAPNSFMVPP